MKLWKISQEENGGYDTYSDAVVVAETAEDAKRIYPRPCFDGVEHLDDIDEWDARAWTNDPEKVAAIYLGEADSAFTSEQIICYSFHAG